MDFGEVKEILLEIDNSKKTNISIMLKRDPERQAAYSADLKAIKKGEKANANQEDVKKAKTLKRDLYRYKTKTDLIHQETENELSSERKRLESENISKISSSDENFKKSVENFLHKNISKDFKATNADIKNFHAAINGEGPKIPERWKRIMIKSLAIKPWQQNTEERMTEKRTKEYFNNLGYKESEKMSGERSTYGAQGNYVTISAKDYNILVKNMPDVYKESNDGANKIVSRSDARKFNLDELSKSSDFWFVTDNGAKTFVTFKSVERNGGTQLHQITDVKNTSGNFKSNFKDKAGQTRSIAVIRGLHIEGLIRPYIKQPCPEGYKDVAGWEREQERKSKSNSGWISYKGENYGPIDMNIGGKIYQIPKIMTEGEWARTMQILARIYRKNNV